MSINPKIVKLYKAASKVLGDWKPTAYQKLVFEDLFAGEKRYVFEEWSRGAGKTVTALKIAFLAAELHPGRSILYVAPTQEDAIKIIRDKFQKEFPHELLDKSSPSTGVFRFKNGSTLILTGSEGNPHQGKGNVGRGLEPVLMIYDEFAYHNKKAHESLAPTLRKDGKLVIISTPPRIDDMESKRAEHYDNMITICKGHNWASFRQVNCDTVVKAGVCTPEFLDMMRADYKGRGEYNEFLAEFYLKRVYRSADTYFKDIDESVLIPDSHMVRLVDNIENPTWVAAGDSSGSSRWGTLFACIDEAKGVLYLVDAIVCKREGSNDTDNRIASGLTPSVYWPKVQHRMQKWYPNQDESKWHIIWDHDTLFIDIIPQLFGFHISIEPVEKHKDKKTEIFSIIRDLMRLNRLYIGESCKELIHEMRLLSVDPKTGDFVKKVDELLDDLRYIIMMYEHIFQNRTPETTVKRSFLQDMLQKHYESKIEQEDELENLLKPGEWWQ